MWMMYFFSLSASTGRPLSARVLHVRAPDGSALLLLRQPLLFLRAAYRFKWKQVANPNKHHVKESSEQTEISAQHDTIGQKNRRGHWCSWPHRGSTEATEVYACVDSYVHGCTYEWLIMCGLVSLFKTFIWSISAITVIAGTALHCAISNIDLLT